MAESNKTFSASVGADAEGPVHEEELARLLGLSRAFAHSKAFNLSAKLGVYELLAKHAQGKRGVA